jgi:imidazolonepropionase-like amidohydrolase
MQEMIRTLAEKKTHVDLTLIAFYLAFWGDEPSVRDEFISLAHPAMAEQWRTVFRFDAGWQADDYRRAKTVWPKIEKFAKSLYEAGVPLTLGTDQGNPFVAPGASLVQEMQLHERAGVPHWAILRMATSEAARILGLGAKTGRIAAGLGADIVFTAENPAEDFSAFHGVRYVLSNGVLYDADALKAASGQDK